MMNINKIKDKLTWYKPDESTVFSAGMLVKTEEGIFLVGDVIGFGSEVESVGCGRCTTNCPADIDMVKIVNKL